VATLQIKPVYTLEGGWAVAARGRIKKKIDLSAVWLPTQPGDQGIA